MLTVWLQIQRLTGSWYSAEYTSFCIGSEASGYLLDASGYQGDAGDALCRESYVDRPQWISNGKMFSTPDHVSADTSATCVTSAGTGWWWNACSTSALNVDALGSWFDDSRFGSADVIASRMMMKAAWL